VDDALAEIGRIGFHPSSTPSRQAFCNPL
jgi:hypothetical protein